MLPENVRHFLRDHLTSFECLELLLLLHRRGGEPASLAVLSRESVGIVDKNRRSSG